MVKSFLKINDFEISAVDQSIKPNANDNHRDMRGRSHTR